MLMTYFTPAICIDCGRETIGGQGHVLECRPLQDTSELERVVFRILREQAIRLRAK